MSNTTSEEATEVNRQRTWLRRWGPAFGMMGLIFFFSSIPGQEFPPLGWWEWLVTNGGHALGYAMLSAAFVYGLSADQPAAPRQLALAVLLAVLYSFSDEFHQAFVPGRTPSLMDLGVDAIGALVGVGVWMYERRRVRA
jgi:hypothetical protein